VNNLNMPSALIHSMEINIVDSHQRTESLAMNTLSNPAKDSVAFVVRLPACSRETFIAGHLSKQYRQDYAAALSELLAAERSITFLSDLPALPAPGIESQPPLRYPGIRPPNLSFGE
jgi:hypothetical protein